MENNIKNILKDPKVKSEIKEELLNDREFITDIAKEIFSTSCSEIGGCYPGTIADFFLKNRK
jgi:hypothetical protein